jgi:aminopeptidase-like protein
MAPERATATPPPARDAGRDLRAVLDGLDPEAAGREMHALVADLYPIPRSITGEGLRETLRRLRRWAPLELTEVPSGTQVFDWTVPPEWNVREAWVKGPRGDVVLDFRWSSLHLVSYSVPFHGRMGLEELKTRIHTLPRQPGLVPFRTSFYEETWGFCASQERVDRLEPGEYEVRVDSTLAPGSLTYGEVTVPGRTEEAVLLFAHACHPALCNDNLSGVAILAWLARQLGRLRPRFTYRIVFAPTTIGAIAWLARNQEAARRIRHGLVASFLGDPGPVTYKRSRRGDAEIDRAVAHVLRQSGRPHSIRDFTPYGDDTRQFCSPGFDLAVGSLMRTPYAEFPEYHTSADDLAFVTPRALGDSLVRVLEVLEVVEGNRILVNRSPFCEPQLGKRGLYQAVGGASHEKDQQMAMLWVLNLCDGRHSLLDVAERAHLPFHVVRRVADVLESEGLLRGETDP